MSKGLIIASVLFSLAVGFVIWSVSYAVLLAYFYKDGAIGNALLQNPFVAAQQVYYYWQDTRLQTVALYALAPALFVSAIIAYNILKPKSKPFGDAAFAEATDIRQGKLFARKGVILGRFGRKLLRVNDARHQLVIGPTRSGKGTGYVLPNVLEYQGSMVITDLKGEIWEQTAAHRKAKGDLVYFFAPGQEKTHRFNPFDFIRTETGDRVNDIQNIAHIMIPDAENSDNAVWSATARNILAGVISYIHESAEYEGRRNFGEVANLFATKIDLQELFSLIVSVEGSTLSKFTKDSFNAYTALTDRGAQSALLDIQRAMEIFRNERIVAATETTDIDIRLLQKRPMTVYLAPSVSDMSIVMPFLRLFIQQTMNELIEIHDKNSRPVLFMLDEFRQLGKMDEIVEKLPYVAGYNIKMCFIIQDLKSLDDVYGQNTRDSMLGNCGYQLVLGANDQTTAEYVSKALGKTTVRYETTSRQIQFAGVHRRTKLENVRDRDLMMPQEVRQLDPDKHVVLIEGRPPVLATKIRSFKERPWKKWIKAATKGFTLPSPVSLPVHQPVPSLDKNYVERNSENQPSDKTSKGSASAQTSRARAPVRKFPEPMHVNDDGGIVTSEKSVDTLRAEMEEARNELSTIMSEAGSSSMFGDEIAALLDKNLEASRPA